MSAPRADLMPKIRAGHATYLRCFGGVLQPKMAAGDMPIAHAGRVDAPISNFIVTASAAEPTMLRARGLR